MANYYLDAIFISHAQITLNLKMAAQSHFNLAQMCVALAQLSLYISISDASVGLIGLGAPNRVKFDITNPDKITLVTKITKVIFSQTRISMYMHSFVYLYIF